jgi:hypothetical protein
MKSRNRVFAAVGLAYLAIVGVETVGAKAQYVKQSKDLGYPAENCLYCHTEKLPKKEKAKEQLNERGKFLEAKRAKADVKDVDLTWLKDYPGGKEQK